MLVLVLVAPAFADRAKSLYDKGKDAEARQQYEQAYEYFKEAYNLKPKDIRYRTTYERLKFLAASAHVHNGQLLREAGKLQEALAEFEKAYAIDPSSFMAQQEIRRTKSLIDQSQKPQATPQAKDTLRQRMERAQGPVELKPVSEQTINLHMTEDARVVYSTIGKLAGINMLFDPDFSSGGARRITVDLNNVTLGQALQIVALESKSFWRPVTPNTIYVAQDSKQKRTELDQSVVKTFYVQNLSKPTDVQDIATTLRQILGVTQVQALTAQGVVVARGTPDQIALAEKLVGDLDRPHAEVVVEVAVMQVRRDKLRELGINPPQTLSVQLQNNIAPTTTTTGVPGTTTTTTSTTGATTGINLNRIGNLTAKDFNVNFPAATISFLFSDANTKIIQNPQIRAVDGEKATLKIGDRIPVASGSFQPGIGGIGINPLVNTQFQYQDVGVNIDMTPTIHSANEVTLKMKLEISSVTGQSNIGGILQPIIGQRTIDHTIRLREGEINLLGGILEETDVKNLQGFPWLAQVPILKYLFSQEHTERHDNEIVFALIPHIVRGPEISELNTRAIDVGTSQNVELHYNGRVPTTQGPSTQPAPVPPTTPPAQPPASQPPAAQPPVATAPEQPAQPTAGAPGTATPPLGPALLSFDPAQLAPAAGSTFTVNVVLNNAANVSSVPVQLTYDDKTLQLLNISNGGFLGRDGQTVALVSRPNPPASPLQMVATRPPGAGGVSGQGAVFTLTFLAKAPGQSVIAINQASARDGNMQAMPISGAQAMVTVK